MAIIVNEHVKNSTVNGEIHQEVIENAYIDLLSVEGSVKGELRGIFAVRLKRGSSVIDRFELVFDSKPDSGNIYEFAYNQLKNKKVKLYTGNTSNAGDEYDLVSLYDSFTDV